MFKKRKIKDKETAGSCDSQLPEDASNIKGRILTDKPRNLSSNPRRPLWPIKVA